MAITATAASESATRVRVTFSGGIDSAPELADASQYTISPTLAVVSAVPEAGPAPTYVDLTVREMKAGRSYTLTVAYAASVTSGDQMWKNVYKVADYTVLPIDGPWAFVNMTTGGSLKNVYLPALSATLPGDRVGVARIGASVVRVHPNGSDTINGSNTYIDIRVDEDTLTFNGQTGISNWKTE